MSKTGSIRQIWEGHWAEKPPAAAFSLQEKVTREAFHTIRRYTSESDREILEVGCGVGRFCALLGGSYPRARVTGIDYSESALAAARQLKAHTQRDNISFGCAGIFELPFASNSFDVVFCEGVLPIFSVDEPPTYMRPCTK